MEKEGGIVMECYKTFIAEGVLTDYSSGMIVVQTTDKKKAIELILKQLPDSGLISDCGMENCNNDDCLEHRVRELKIDEVIVVYGGQ